MKAERGTSGREKSMKGDPINNQNKAAAGDSGALSGHEKTPEEKALAHRPSFSIRLRIILAFLIAFLFSFGIAVSSIIFISRMNTIQVFFDRAGEIVFEIQEARRYEKNFFLFGAKSDLYDASSRIHVASNLIETNEKEMRSILGRKDFDTLTANLLKYEELLRKIELSNAANSDSIKVDPDIEDQVRFYGHQILSHSTDLIDRERAKVSTTARLYMLSSIFLVIINLIVMTWVATELLRQILRPLGRAVGYTQRIASGDFTPITPTRKYRDEFSNLAIAINKMIHELGVKQEQLVQSRKMAAVGTLTSGIAHELNNPLNNISIITEALLMDTGGYTEEQQKKMLRDIFTQVERAGATVRNLLDFTREEQFRMEAIAVRELIKSSLKLVANEKAINRIRTEIDIPEILPKIRGDFRNLQQVFLNLFLNSIQAMPDGGVVRVSACDERNGFVRVDVSDTGCGIAAENMDKIFDPFFTTKEVGQGTGLGLSVSYGIIQRIGGWITVESEVGKGATFSIFLPVVRENGSAS
ncbi:MAG: ATP-binding protein [bacterium]